MEQENNITDIHAADEQLINDEKTTVEATKEVTEIPTIDFSSLSTEDIVKHLQKLMEQYPVNLLKDIMDSLPEIFETKYNAEYATALAAFTADGDNPEDFDYKKVKSRYYPYVKLNAGYGYTANWTEVGNYDLQQRLGLNYGVTIGMSLFDGFNRKREQRNARIQIENQQLRIQELELALRADMSNFWMAYKNNLDLWSLEKENLVAAQENYRIAIDRYKLGELSGIELREAQNSLLEAEERLSVAEYSTKICEISLLQLSGQILTYIRPEPEKASF